MKLATFWSRELFTAWWSNLPKRYFGLATGKWINFRRQQGYRLVWQSCWNLTSESSQLRRRLSDHLEKEQRSHKSQLFKTESLQSQFGVIQNALDCGDFRAVASASACLYKTDESLSFLYKLADSVTEKLVQLTTEERHRGFYHTVSLFSGLGLRARGKKEYENKLQVLTDQVAKRLPQLSKSVSESEACRKTVWMLYSLSCLTGVDASAAIDFLKEVHGKHIWQLEAEELSRLAMALSRQRALSGQLSDDLAEASADAVDAFSLKSLVATLTSFSFAGVKVPQRLFDAASTRLTSCLSDLSDKNLAQLCEALSVYSHTALATCVYSELSKRIMQMGLRDAAPTLLYVSSCGLLDSQLLSGLKARAENIPTTLHPRTVSSLVQSLVYAPRGPARDQVVVSLLHNIPSDARQSDCFAILNSLEHLGDIKKIVPFSMIEWLFGRVFSNLTTLAPREICRLAWVALSVEGLSADHFLKDPEEVNVTFKPATPESIASLCSAASILRLKGLPCLRQAVAETIRQHEQLLQEHAATVVCLVHTLAVLREPELLRGMLPLFSSLVDTKLEALTFSGRVSLVWSVVALRVLTVQKRISLVNSVLGCPDQIPFLSTRELLELQELNWWFAEKTDMPVNSAIQESLSQHLQHVMRIHQCENSDISLGLAEIQATLKPGSCKTRVQLSGGPMLHAAVLLDKDFLPCSWQKAQLDPTELDQRVARRRGFVCVAVLTLARNSYLRSTDYRLSGDFSVLMQILKSSGWTTLVIASDQWLAKADKAADFEQWRVRKMLKDSFGEIEPDQTITDDDFDDLAAGYGDDSVVHQKANLGKRKPKSANHLKKKR